MSRLLSLAKLALRGLPKLPNESQEIKEIEREGLKKLKLFRGLDKEHRFTADKTYSLE